MSIPTPLQYAYAADVYEKLEDHKALVNLYVETHQWDNVRWSVHLDTYTHTYRIDTLLGALRVTSHFCCYRRA